MAPPDRALGARIKALRLARGESRCGFWMRTRIPPHSLLEIEHGRRRPQRGMLAEIARALESPDLAA